MKIKLGEKMSERGSMAPPDEMMYPTIRISKKSGGYKAGDTFKATISGTVKSETHIDGKKSECVLEIHDINFGSSGKPSPKEPGEAFDEAMRNSKSKKPETGDDYGEET